MRFHLEARPPFSFHAVVHSHGWASLAPFSHDDDTGTLSYVLRLPTGRVVELVMSAESAGVDVGVSGDLSAGERDQVLGAVRWMLDLDLDMTAFYAIAQAEPKLAHVVGNADGRLLRSPSLFEDLVKTILTTNTSWGGTKRMVRSLVDRYGSPLPGDDTRRAFPTPGQLAAAEEEALRSTGLGYRSPYVSALARDVSGGQLDLEALKATDAPTAELRKRLLAIKGVGAYAAANLLMILGRYDDLPVDSWALTMVSREWHDGQPIGQAEVEAAFQRFGPWKGLAYWFWDWSAAA